MNSEQLNAVMVSIRLLVSAISSADLYSPDHPQIARLCEQALSSLESAMPASSKLSLVTLDDQLIIEGQAMENTLYLSRFVQALKERGIGHLKLIRGIAIDDLVALVINLSKRGAGRRCSGEIQSTEHLRYGKVEVRFSAPGSGPAAENLADPAGRPVSLNTFTEEDLAGFLELYEGVRKKNKLNVVGIFDLVSGFIDGFKLSSFIDTFKKQTDPLMVIAPLRSADEATFIHSVNVCILTLAQAASLGIEGQPLHDIGVAAMLHDIGKMFVPGDKEADDDEPVENLVPEDHPARGAEFLLEMPGVPKLAVVTAFEHHLGYNRSGYPKVSSSWKQNICSHMTTISDYYDTLRSSYGSQGGIPMEDVSAFMLELAGTELHPKLTRNFIDMMNRVVTHKE